MPYSHNPVIGTNHIFKKCVYFFRATSKVTCGGELKYLFSCVDEDDWPCLVKNKEGEFDDLPDSESPELRIKANRFESNKTYTFTLGVFKGTQNVTASVRVKISPGTPPTVQIKKPKDGVKPVVRVRIKSSTSGTTSFNCEGVVEEGYGYVDFDDKDKVTGEFSGEGMKFNQRRLRFTFKGLRSGVEYKVRCYAYHDDTPDEIGESTTTFTVESPPEGGALAVEPAEGVSSETQFSIVASEFISDSPISIDYYTKDKRDRLTLLESNSDASLELQLPAGEGDDGDIDVVAVAKNKFGETKAAAKVRSRPKQFQAEDFDDIDSKMKDLEDQGDEAGRVALAHSVLSSAKNQEGLEEEVSQLEEETSIVITSLLASKREEGSGDVGDLFALARKFKPQTEETKTALVDEVTLAVEDTVPDSVRRRSDVQGGGGESRKRRRRAIEEDTDDDDESGMSVSEIEDILATFENLIDTTVVNNNTANFLQTVDSVLINMCKGLPLGETSVALSNLGILKADMNYLDNVDTTFLNVSCSNCSMLNHSALAKFGSEIKQMYNEWNCSGDDELCNGLCIAMAQYPHDYITAVTSPIRLSDVVYVELKNPENQDHVPISSLTQPAFFHIPLHAGYSQTSGHKCMLWSESEEQWSASGCQKTQAFTRDSVVYVECNCTKLGYITVHESDDDVQFNTQTSTEGTTQAQSAPTTTATTGGMSTTKGKENHVATAELSFDLDYNTVITDSETKIQFINVVEQKLADTMEVDPSMILNVTISPGSIVVNFILLAPEQNPSTSLNYSLTQLMLAVNKQQFTVMLNGQEYTARNGSMTYEYKTMTGVSPDEGTVTTISEEDESKLPIILGVVFGVLLIVIIIVAVLFRRHLAKQTKVSDQNIRGSTTCAQNTGYQGSVGNDMGRPVTPGNAAPVETQHSTGGPRAGSGGVRQTAELPHIE
ncbi:uncharacterized protein LOC110241572 [Paramuricea clavata]|uniref:Uncharacterized protein LOC110241572 n=1 Tax=Paramuricea clavata TaxID=317549 RepID=A0A6S7HU53_PARCT|nr:uncharacterized protein LOC110241572 [Paramuricea clavata]